ncbi:hypothetical protein ACMC56_00095 [Campylobacterota bacterium DY0563]
MTMPENTIDHQLERAIESNDLRELWILHKSPSMNVRRAVAKNINIDSKIANNLAMDPVLNVSYIASKHPKCETKRDFCPSIISACVECMKDERGLVCTGCEKLTNSSLTF